MASTLFPRTRLYCSNCGEIVGTLRITGVICDRKSGGCVRIKHSTAAYPKGTSYGDAEASPSGRSTQRQGDKRSAPQGYLLRGTAADLIASHAPLRARRKSPWGKAVRTKHVRMAQNITPGIQRGPQPPWHAFLPYLSSCNERWGHRRSPVAERGR